MLRRTVILGALAVILAAPAAAHAAARELAQGADDAPVALVVVAVLGGLALLGLLLWGVARFFAWNPAWLVATRHAIAEAGWRTSGAWADFTDWLRRGRSAPR